MAYEGRAGSMSVRKSHERTMKGPDYNSKTSKRRKNRNFISLEKSSRIHRRAESRSIQVRTQYGKVYKAGEKVDPGGGAFVHIAGGSIKYY